MVAEWSKTLISHIQVENTAAQVTGSNIAWDLHAICHMPHIDCDMTPCFTQVVRDNHAKIYFLNKFWPVPLASKPQT